MQSHHYILNLAGRRVPCAFRFPDTASCFGSWIEESAAGETFFSVSAADWEFWPGTGKPVDASAEYNLFSAAASTALLPAHACVFHAAAFRRGGKAYLISAPPGVGKTTQLRNLRELWPGEFSVISGDRPVLETREDGSVLVHPSPWNGKEGWGGASAAPLAGLILLRRGEKNDIRPCAKEDAAIPVFSSLFQSAENAEILRHAAAMATDILSCAPVWSMTTFCVPDSTRLLYRTLFSEEETAHDL